MRSPLKFFRDKEAIARLLCRLRMDVDYEQERLDKLRNRISDLEKSCGVKQRSIKKEDDIKWSKYE